MTFIWDNALSNLSSNDLSFDKDLKTTTLTFLFILVPQPETSPRNVVLA